MVVANYRIAAFSDVTAQVVIPNVEKYWKCRTHGKVFELVKYFGRADGPAEWACPDCLEKHLGKPIREARDMLTCYKCGSLVTLEECAVCGKDTCASHRVEGTCDECWESVNILPGYSGI